MQKPACEDAGASLCACACVCARVRVCLIYEPPRPRWKSPTLTAKNCHHQFQEGLVSPELTASGLPLFKMEISLTLPAKTVSCLEENTDLWAGRKAEGCSSHLRAQWGVPVSERRASRVLEAKAPGPPRGSKSRRSRRAGTPADFAAV